VRIRENIESRAVSLLGADCVGYPSHPSTTQNREIHRNGEMGEICASEDFPTLPRIPSRSPPSYHRSRRDRRGEWTLQESVDVTSRKK